MLINKTYLKKLAPYITVIVSIAIIMFVFTINARAPWRGKTSDTGHQAITAEILKFATNWYEDNPVALKFALLELPNSIESQNIQDRMPYVSYGPGAVLPIYIIAKVFNHEPTLYLVHDYNLLNHFLIGLLLSAIAFSIARGFRLSYSKATIVALIPLPLTYLLPGPMYFFQNVYFADTAIILPATILVLLETWRYFKQDVLSNRWLYIIQFILLLYGTLTDWYFIFLALGIFLLRLANEEYNSLDKFIRKTLSYWLPVVIALSLFVLQIASLDGGDALYNKFFGRVSEICKQYPQINMTDTYWQKYIPDSFGNFAVGMLWVSLIITFILLVNLIYKRIKRSPISANTAGAVSIATLLLILPFIRIYTLRCHSVFHDFTTMLFVGAIALVPFVILPLLLTNSRYLKIDDYKLKIGKRTIVIAIFPIMLLVISFSYAFSEYYRYLQRFPEINTTYVLYGEFIHNNVGYNDIIFSPDYSAIAPPASMPAQQITFTKKLIYPIAGIEDILHVTTKLKGEYKLKIFVRDNNTKLNESIKILLSKATNQQSFSLNGVESVLYEIPSSALESR